ncbi:MAG: ATP-dependent DNA helicase RecG [Propionibacteriaceae bacterium]
MLSVYRSEAFRELDVPLAEALGEKSAKALAKLRLFTVGDLLRHVPRSYFQGTEVSDLGSLRPGDDAAVMAHVRSVQESGYGSKARVEATVTDGKGILRLTFFSKHEHYRRHWVGLLKPGTRGLFVGKIGEFGGNLQMTHPTFVTIDEQGKAIGKKDADDLISSFSRSGLVGIYPATATLPTWQISACAQLLVDRWQGIADPLPLWVREAALVPELGTALADIHNPDTFDQARAGLRRLEFDEAFGAQLMMLQRRRLAAALQAVPYRCRNGGLLDAFDARLPFALTQGQQDIGEEIFADIAKNRPMQRLLQGEVGSGKTLVALRAMLTVVDGGGQAVLLAPTEVLATQHALTIKEMLGNLADGGTLAAPDHATRVVLLTGSMNTAQKRAAMLDIASGEAGLIVGTHALLADKVSYAQLGLVVVDEQHRFGVEQRNALSAKAEKRPHVLVMTATPIPRTVAMTLFGDLEVSSLRQLPQGRSDVTTTVVDELEHPTWVKRAWARIREEVQQGRQAFVVASRIGGQIRAQDTSEDIGDDQLAGVVELYEQLSQGDLAGLRVGLLHGQLPADVKDATMAAFASGELDVLVATTVIEVGVNVPNASVMVIVDAERFGISQLHQLRGRIGRGSHAGLCLLLTKATPDSTARERLDAVASTRDGFALADVDLEQRREGDVLGSSQAGGRSRLRLLRVVDHVDVITHARGVALEVLRRDPELSEGGLVDYVTSLERLAADDWWEKG